MKIVTLYAYSTIDEVYIYLTIDYIKVKPFSLEGKR